MGKRASWFARVLGFDDGGDAGIDDGYASFEHIDGSQLAAGEFHLSDSMRLDEASAADFSETLPAYSRLARPVPVRARHGGATTAGLPPQTSTAR